MFKASLISTKQSSSSQFPPPESLSSPRTSHSVSFPSLSRLRGASLDPVGFLCAHLIELAIGFTAAAACCLISRFWLFVLYSILCTFSSFICTTSSLSQSRSGRAPGGAPRSRWWATAGLSVVARSRVSIGDGVAGHGCRFSGKGKGEDKGQCSGYKTLSARDGNKFLGQETSLCVQNCLRGAHPLYAIAVRTKSCGPTQQPHCVPGRTHPSSLPRSQPYGHRRDKLPLLRQVATVLGSSCSRVLSPKASGTVLTIYPPKPLSASAP